MDISRITLKNITAVVLIAAFLLLSQEMAPPRTLKEANLWCPMSGINMSFESMKACTSNTSNRAGCGCAPQHNAWFTSYHWGLIPLLTALIGLVTLRGKLTTRLLVLNCTILFVVIINVIAGIQQHDSAVMGIPLIPVIAAVEGGITSGWFLFFRLCYKKINRNQFPP